MAYSTHQPFLKFYIQHTTNDILEFGTGDGSTGFILDLIKDTNRKLVSYENNREWYDKMVLQYPPNEQHSYVFVDDWEEVISNIVTENISIVFIDQAPWEARVTTMNHFKDHVEYVMIHDVDYFPKNKMFGTYISEYVFDFSDVFKSWGIYYPKLPWPCRTGPPTLVGSNTGGMIYDVTE